MRVLCGVQAQTDCMSENMMSIAERLADPGHADLVEEIRREVLLGDEEVEEISSSLASGFLEAAECDQWEEDMEEPDEDEQEVMSDRFVRAVWNDTAEKARAWAGETTDVDRLRAAFDRMREQNIVVAEFSDWGDMEDDESHLGAAMTSVYEIERIELGPVRLSVAFRSLAGRTRELCDAVLAALTEQGLSPQLEGDKDDEVGVVTLDLVWHPHVEPVDPEGDLD